MVRAPPPRSLDSYREILFGGFNHAAGSGSSPLLTKLLHRMHTTPHAGSRPLQILISFALPSSVTLLVLPLRDTLLLDPKCVISAEWKGMIPWESTVWSRCVNFCVLSKHRENTVDVGM